MFHVGHLNILKKSKELCDYLLVGVTVDELVSYKNKSSIINFEDRKAIIESIKYVDEVTAQSDMDKIKAFNKHKFDVMFVGSDWKGTDKWNSLEKEFQLLNVDIVYFDYTVRVSSSNLKKHLDKVDN